jgi:hypothetical protein
MFEDGIPRKSGEEKCCVGEERRSADVPRVSRGKVLN